MFVWEIFDKRRASTTIFSNTFTTKFKWQVVTSSNLILSMKLLFCPPVIIYHLGFVMKLIKKVVKVLENIVNIAFLILQFFGSTFNGPKF